MEVWALSKSHSEGKYLVVRRDGTVPEWPHFVMGAFDPCVPEALRTYAQQAHKRGYDPKFVESIYKLADQYELVSASPEAIAKAAPDAPPHRIDDPAVIRAMQHKPSTIGVRPDKPASVVPEPAASLTLAINWSTITHSSNLDAVGRDDAGNLYIRFKMKPSDIAQGKSSGDVYVWDDLAGQHFDSVLNSFSPGSYIHKEMSKGRKV